jgi:hypothetical protein
MEIFLISCKVTSTFSRDSFGGSVIIHLSTIPNTVFSEVLHGFTMKQCENMEINCFGAL